MKRFKLHHLFLLFLIGLLWLSVKPGILHGEPKDAVAESFGKYDVDGNGRITPSELVATKAFSALDQDGDGEITLTEARRAVKAGALEGIELPAPVTSKPTPRDNSSPAAVNEVSPAAVNEVSPAAVNEVAATEEIRQAPRWLKPGDHGVGRLIKDLTFTDINGASHTLSDLGAPKATVIALTGIGCPLCQKYTPTLARIEQQFADRGVRFVFVNPNESESIDKLKQTVDSFGLAGPYIRDTRDEITGALDARTTTEVFVLDAARTLVYRGAVDDQYGFGYSLNEPRANYLVDALEAMVDGRQPEIAATTSPGCDLYYEQPLQPNSVSLTYHNRISRILQDNCLECHREEGQAPFSLESHEAVRDYAAMIKNVIRRGVMPPWFAASPTHSGSEDNDQEGSEVHAMRWANDRSLADADRRDLIAWIDSGAIEGDAVDAPLPRTYPTQWIIGEPDLVVEIPRPIDVQASGRMPYQHAQVATRLDEDRWIQAVEIQPTARAVVHHVLVFVKDGSDRSGRIDERAGFLAAYVPGNTYQQYPQGLAKKLPAGSSLVFQIHYTPNGRATQDQTKLGIVFAEQPPRRMIRNTGIANHKIAIPPGDDNHPESASLRVPADVQLIALMPHMHLRGKAFRYDVTYPDGRQERLLEVPRYDFNWQLEYRLAEPLDVPRGSLIEITGWFDNSEGNPANPDPDATVRWGPQTEDEMLLGYIEYVTQRAD